MREIEFKITDKDDGRQIKDFLRDFGVSASLLTRLKQSENGITKNGGFARAIDEIRTGDTLKIRIESRGKMPAPSEDTLDIAFEDEDILIVNKPPFMPVHESRNHIGDALSNAVAAHLSSDENTAFRAVYRLDRDTSGLVLIAKNELAAAKLVTEKQLSVRETERMVRRMNQPEKEAAPDWKVIDQGAYDELELQLRKKLETKVAIRRSEPDKGQIGIDYYSVEDLERIADKLKREGI